MSALLGTVSRLIVFSFRTWDYISHSLLACRVSGEKSVHLIGDPLKVIWHFSLEHFLLFSFFFFFFEIFTVICDDEYLFWSCVFGILCTSCTYISISFSKLGKFFAFLLLTQYKSSKPFCFSISQELLRHMCLFIL